MKVRKFLSTHQSSSTRHRGHHHHPELSVFPKFHQSVSPCVLEPVVRDEEKSNNLSHSKALLQMHPPLLPRWWCARAPPLRLAGHLMRFIEFPRTFRSHKSIIQPAKSLEQNTINAHREKKGVRVGFVWHTHASLSRYRALRRQKRFPLFCFDFDGRILSVGVVGGVILFYFFLFFVLFLIFISSTVLTYLQQRSTFVVVVAIRCALNAWPAHIAMIYDWCGVRGSRVKRAYCCTSG